MSYHTPGPWMRGSGGCYQIYGPKIDGKQMLVASAASQNEADDYDYVTVRANAKLIEASPDLLQALQLVAAHIPEIIAAGILTAAETDTIRAAITKAGG